MATSGSKDFTITRANIIEAALRKVGAFDQGEAVSGSETSAANIALNLLVKEYTARGADLWLRDEITLFLQPDQKVYSLGTANATASYVETTITADQVASATVIPVTSSTGMTAADIIGIKLDDNTIHWDVIATVDSSIQVTITTGILTAASSAGKVYAYTTTAGRPTRVLYAYRRDTSDIDVEVRLVGEKEYMSQSNKGSDGPPVEAWYQPTLTTGSLYVWPVNGGSTLDKLVMSCQFHADDFDAAGDNPEFPIEWGNTLVWGLAAELGSEYGIPEREQGRLWSTAEFKLNNALDFDTEYASLEFVLDVR